MLLHRPGPAAPVAAALVVGCGLGLLLGACGPTTSAAKPGSAPGGGKDAGVVLTDPDADLDGDGYTPNQGDCKDTDPFTHPGADEVCNGNDDDCDGLVDE